MFSSESRDRVAVVKSAEPSLLGNEAENLRVEVVTLRQRLAEMQQELDASRGSDRDALTDTPNRTLMRDRLETAILFARRHRVRIAVLFLDLDEFKLINDTFGHATGDEVLRLVARRIESAVRASDTVSRHGGDEFLVLLSEIRDASDASVIVSKILAALAAPRQVFGQVLALSASIGIAIYPNHGKDAETLIARADAAMYRSKSVGHGGFQSYSKRNAQRRPINRSAHSGTETSNGVLLSGAANRRVTSPVDIPALGLVRRRAARWANRRHLLFEVTRTQILQMITERVPTRVRLANARKRVDEMLAKARARVDRLLARRSDETSNAHTDRLHRIVDDADARLAVQGATFENKGKGGGVAVNEQFVAAANDAAAASQPETIEPTPPAGSA